MIHFVSVNAKLLKLGTCTVVSVKGTLVEAKMFTLEYTHVSSTRVPFTLTTVQLPNLDETVYSAHGKFSNRYNIFGHLCVTYIMCAMSVCVCAKENT